MLKKEIDPCNGDLVKELVQTDPAKGRRKMAPRRANVPVDPEKGERASVLLPKGAAFRFLALQGCCYILGHSAASARVAGSN